MSLPNHLIRLEPSPDGHLDDAIGGHVHDPVWFLARQWQMGEFQGENATTPVKASLKVSSRMLRFEPGSAALDDLPATTPAEALVESEKDDWWTIGRRIRAGRIAAEGRVLPDDDSLRLIDPPPPYDTHRGAWDGRELWRRRAPQDLGIPDAAFGETPPEETPSLWDSTTLVYDQEEVFSSEGIALDLVRHRGGRMDWYSVDARDTGTAGTVAEQDREVIPTRIRYPGMPKRGLWEIEDTDTDIGATAPDSSHTATAIMTDLFFSHRDEWFDIPVGGSAGSILKVARIVVTDDFGLSYDSDATAGGGAPAWPGLRPPEALEPRPDGDTAWSLFRTAGLEPDELLLWHVAELPLVGEPVERVQLGIDDQSNLLWALERRLDSRDLPNRRTNSGPEAVVPLTPHNPPVPDGDFTHEKAYTYVPSRGAAPHWIPYTLDPAAGKWEFVQRRLADYSVDPPRLMPEASADSLVVPAEVHRIAAAAVPTMGIEIERRWQLARDNHGAPVLWVQRQRRPLTSPAARRLRFDVAEQTGLKA